MALGYGRLLRPPSTESTDESRRTSSRSQPRHESAQSKNQRARTKLSLIIASVILVPIVTQIQPTCSQVHPITVKSQQQQQQQQQQPRATTTATTTTTTTTTSQRAEDWARRLRPVSSSNSSERRQDEASAPGNQQMLIEPSFAHANQTPLWLRALSGNQPSPLGRALEATRIFMQQQTLSGPPPRFPLIQSLVAASRGGGGGGGESRLPQQVGAPTNSAPNITTANRLKQFLFQPKSSSSHHQLSLTSQQRQQVAATSNSTRGDQEPIQSASSENYLYERARPSESTSGWPHKLLKDGRSLVTLSAPYEQAARTLNESLLVANRTSRASGVQTSGRPVNLIAAASGDHQLTTSLSYADGSRLEDPTAGGEAGSSDAEQSGQEPDQAQEVYYLEQQQPLSGAHGQRQQVVVQMSQEEAEQQQQQHQHQSDSDASAQWNATSQLSQSNPDLGPPDGSQDPELQDQMPEAGQQQQVDESSQLPGEEPQQQQQQEEEVQLQMNANGELFEGPGSDVSFGQRPPVASNETGAYLQLAYEPSPESDRKSSKQPGGDDDRNRQGNSTTGYILPVASPMGGGRDFSRSSPQAGDEGSLAAAQLPSQYESIIRVPPEGHYDDYFKPLGGAAGDEHGRLVFAASSSATADFRAQQQQNETGEHEQQQQQQQQQAVVNLTNHDADSQYQYFMNQQQMFADQQQRGHNPPPSAISNHREQQQQRPSEDANSSHLIQYETQRAQPDQQPPQLYQVVYQQNQTVHQAAGVQHTSNSSGAAESLPAGEQQDNIQLIVANSAGNLQDPNTHEKVITYTSEAGRNFARLVGKPARHTFYNKDLNESPPPPTPPGAATPSPTSTAPPTSSLAPSAIAVKFRSTRSPEYPTPAQTSRPALAMAASTHRSDELADDEPSAGVDEETVALDDEGVLPAGQFGQYATSGQPLQRQAGGGGGLAYRGGRGRPAGNHRPANELRATRQQNRGMMGGRTPPQHPVGNRLARQPTLSKQHSMGRPQVTEATFELKELPLNAPTAMPSVGASTVRSIAELPTKVKRLREHQVDKNELMNELLTALDRVKAAIYKLQPLTAKMNAMYRKSVTSNTRDQILDNNKGTYSKRYPPGDFDDTYDRMHPSEILEHQQRLSSRGGEGRAARLNRAASGGNSTSAGARRQRHGANSQRADSYDQEPSDSKTIAVYLPAPADFRRQDDPGANMTGGGGNKTGGGEQLVTSGTGRRVGGKLRGRLSLRSSSGGEIVYDDEGDHLLSLPSERTQLLSKRSGHIGSDGGMLITDEGTNSTTGGGFRELTERLDLGDDESEPPEGGGGPLFGYRITIYQSPELGDSATPLSDSQAEEANRILSYSLIDDDGGGASEEDGGQSQVASTNSGDQDELMATSESSVVTTPEFDDEDRHDDRDTSESQASKRKKMMAAREKEKKKKSGKEEEEEERAKKKREREHKKGNKWSRHEKRGRKGEEEHRKKKEFKKINHHKSVMSKESHKLHRDKHIKAHDRGAAKEKALKERTQIEFFEREQIVDDEFEKGKKSTVKAGWASGHDAKKSSLEVGGGHQGRDSMTMGGSQHVNHLESPLGFAAGGPAAAASSAQPMLMAASEQGDSGGGGGKGHGHSSESSSGKQSNKYEKRQMEARGKKFKGWREKGYKIITETEFIDRGSLHDSAYKKRDKGAAHHQKVKQQEAKSEGHQGSSHEHHKKSHKKEEKKSKMEEKKKATSGREGEEGGAKKMKKQHEEEKKRKKEKKQEEADHDQEESAPTMSSLGDTGGPLATEHRAYGRRPSSSANNTSGHGQATTLRPSFQVTATTTTTTLRPLASNRTSFHLDGADPAALARHRYVVTPSSALESPGPDAAAAGRRSDRSPESRRENRKSGAPSNSTHRQLNGTSLSELINRLNPSQARARAEASSPLLRLVNTLAKLDSQQRQLGAASTQQQTSSSGQKQQVPAAGVAQLGANQQQSRAAPWQALGADQRHRTNHNEQQPLPMGNPSQPSASTGHQSAFAHQKSHLTQQQQSADRLVALPHLSNNPRLDQQNSNGMYLDQQRPQIYLQPPVPPSGAYLPPVSESSPFSFMADSRGLDALASNFDPFDYEQLADSQQQQQQQLYGSLPNQLQAPHHRLQQFNFLTDRR